MPKPKALLAWSSGKDSAYALAVVRQQNEVDVVGLLTTINTQFERVAMHAVRERLVELQSEAVGLPLWKVPIPYPCPNAAYEAAMSDAVRRAVDEGIGVMVFGDLFLEDIRAYRERQLQGTGLTPLFPLWRRDTTELAREMMASGVKATLTCVDPKQLDPRFAGRNFDESFLAELPPSVDPCGEKGEFHTFAWDGPAFRHPVSITVGDTVERDGFVFTDLLPA
jgi:uncharacterized protein (TIGR00290 family)